MECVFLSDKFYFKYKNCSEIEQKITRPYICLKIKIDNLVFAIPLRSHIKHNHVLWTDKENKCGVDFSKAVVITDESNFINYNMKPHIRDNEFKVLKCKEYEIQKKMLKYISEYKKAKTRLDIDRNRLLCQYSCLKYFEEYIVNIP